MSYLQTFAILWLSSQFQANHCFRPILIVISFDGFRNDYISPDLTPNLHKLGENGVRAHMISNMITKTYPNHHSIATGFYEENHGIVSNNFFDPKYNQTFDIDHSSDQWWTEAEVTPVWISNQLNGGSSGVISWAGGHVRYNGIRPRHYLKYDHRVRWSSRIDSIMKWLTDKSDPVNCIFAYFNEPDNTAHHFGPFHQLVTNEVQVIDKLVAKLLIRLKENGLSDRTNLIILSDHGMAEVKPNHKIYLNSIIDPKTYSSYGTSPVLSILPKEGFEEIVYEKLKKASNSMPFSVYKRQEIPEQFHYRNNRRILPILLITNEGWNVWPSKQIKKDMSYWNRGNHGWDNSLPSMRPLFLASGPAFKSSYNHSKTFLNSDLFSLMLEILKIPIIAYKSDSNFDNVKDMLR